MLSQVRGPSISLPGPNLPTVISHDIKEVDLIVSPQTTHIIVYSAFQVYLPDADACQGINC